MVTIHHVHSTIPSSFLLAHKVKQLVLSSFSYFYVILSSVELADFFLAFGTQEIQRGLGWPSLGV